jgi:isopentenyl diphosphate isomerase/L-lactate dehydrogenase-like FMN-dependent dehydrogenase
MIALGADAVLIGRPFAYSIFGGDDAGVVAYLDQLKEDFKNVLVMTNTKNIDAIDRSKLRF